MLWKRTFLILLLTVIMVLNIHDFYTDYQDKAHSVLHLWVEAALIFFSSVGIAISWHEIRLRQREAERLRVELRLTRDQLSNTHVNLKMMQANIQQASQQYAQTVKEQLTAWHLTPSEMDIAFLLLKGLSFDEISQVRDTKEKTVRQQASAIYRKSGLNGRHELAAWFFEDLLS